VVRVWVSHFCASVLRDDASEDADLSDANPDETYEYMEWLISSMFELAYVLAILRVEIQDCQTHARVDWLTAVSGTKYANWYY
jgi:hypothetical protein